MAKIQFKSNPRTNEVQAELAGYLNFCREYGYRFNEGDLFNLKSYPFQQFSKFKAGKRVKDMWLEDGRKFGLVVEVGA